MFALGPFRFNFSLCSSAISENSVKGRSFVKVKSGNLLLELFWHPPLSKAGTCQIWEEVDWVSGVCIFVLWGGGGDTEPGLV